MQLATYTWLLDPINFNVDCKYFLFPKKQFLQDDKQNWRAIWQNAVDTWKIRQKQMENGFLERGFADDDELKKRELRDALPFIKNASCAFCNYSSLCGREGDNA